MSLKEYKIYVAVIYGNIYFYSEEKIYGIIFATNLKVGIIFFFVLKRWGKGRYNKTRLIHRINISIKV